MMLKLLAPVRKDWNTLQGAPSPPVRLVALRVRHAPVAEGALDGRDELDVPHVAHLLVPLPGGKVDAPVALVLQKVFQYA